MGDEPPPGQAAAGRGGGTVRSPEPLFSAHHLPSEPETWPSFRKKVTTRALRVVGPFTVLTSEGPVRCADGWLAIDARGYPYPIADSEMRLIYEPCE